MRSSLRSSTKEIQSDPSEVLHSLLLRASQFDAVLMHMPHGLCMFDSEKRLILCNAAYGKLYDLPPDLMDPGTSLQRILDYRRSVGNAPSNLDTYFDVVHASLEAGHFQNQRVGLEDGRTIQITHNPMPSNGYVATHEDVTVQVLAEVEIRRLASCDPLTGLLNRSSFEKMLQRAVAGVRTGEMFAVHYMDLDDFKAVNDTYGHHAGDLLLRDVASRFQSCLQTGDSLARLGGDEFAVLQVDVKNASEASNIAAKLVCQSRNPFDIDKHTVRIGTSVGTSMYPQDAESSEALLKCADMALYGAKHGGRNSAVMFSGFNV